MQPHMHNRKPLHWSDSACIQGQRAPRPHRRKSNKSKEGCAYGEQKKGQLSRLHNPFTDRPIRLCDVGIRPTRTRACAGCRSGGGGRAAAAGPDASSHCCPPSLSWYPGLLLLIRMELLLTPMHVLIDTAAAVAVSGYRHSDSCCPTNQFGWEQRMGHNVPRAPSVGRAMADANAMSIHFKAHPSNLLPDVGARREHP